MTTTNANCLNASDFSGIFPDCDKALSAITEVTNPDGSITYSHTDGDGGATVSWTTGGPSVADIYVNNGSFDAATGELTLNDTDAGTPDVVIQLGIADGDALNGVSLDANNRVVLGNDVGGTGAQLISDREIDMDGNNIQFIGEGNFGFGRTASTYKSVFNYNGPASFANVGSNFLTMWQNNGTSAVGLVLSDDLEATWRLNNGYHFVIQNDNGIDIVDIDERVIINSEFSDDSGLVLSRIDGNSPKEDCSTATSLGYDNATGLVVPFEGDKVITEADPSESNSPNTPMTNGDSVARFVIGQENFTNNQNCDVRIRIDYSPVMTFSCNPLDPNNYNIGVDYRHFLRIDGTTVRTLGNHMALYGNGDSQLARRDTFTYSSFLVPAGSTVTIGYDCEIERFATDAAANEITLNTHFASTPIITVYPV